MTLSNIKFGFVFANLIINKIRSLAHEHICKRKSVAVNTFVNVNQLL